LATARDSPVIIDSSTSAVQLGSLHGLGGAIGSNALGGVRQQIGQRRKRPLGLHDRAHLDPVTQAHDRDQCRELPPDVDLEQAQRGRPGRHEGDHDRQGDERHHARQPLGQLAARSLQEHEAAVGEDDGAQDGRDPVGAGERRRGVSQPHLDLLAPDDDRDGQRQDGPELAPEGIGVVAGMCPVAAVITMATVRAVITMATVRAVVIVTAMHPTVGMPPITALAAVIAVGAVVRGSLGSWVTGVFVVPVRPMFGGLRVRRMVVAAHGVVAVVVVGGRVSHG
jgi:hypothetical protein